MTVRQNSFTPRPFGSGSFLSREQNPMGSSLNGDLPGAYVLGQDGELRFNLAFSGPPRAGIVTSVLSSGQVELTLDDADGAVATAWSLNGFTYTVGDVVYVLFAANNPDSGIVIGSKAPYPGMANLHVADGSGGHFRALGKTGVDAIPVTLIADGSGDVTTVVQVCYAVQPSGGGSSAGATTVAPAGNVDLYNAGGETLNLRCNADGSLDVRRTAGSGTFTVAVTLVWL